MIISKGITFGKGIHIGEDAQTYPKYTVTTNKYAFLQGDTLTISVTTQNVLDGTLLYWNVEGLILPGYMNVQSGSFKIVNNQATINVTFLNDLRSLVNPGMSNFFYVSIRTSPATGPIVASTQKCIISAAGIAASGGTTSTVAGYKYHVFTTSGTFTPTFIPEGSTIETLVVGGGGGGGASLGGGGGAGGVVYTAAQSITTIPYAITIGGGGPTGSSGGSHGVIGGNTDLASFVTALGGGPGGVGGGGTSTATSTAGASGGGGSSSLSVFGCPGGTATQPTSQWGGYGNTGGNGIDGVPNTRPCGGGGGAGGVGGNAGYYYGGNGGIGYTNTMLVALQLGQSSGGYYYIAGGGAGNSTGTRTPGTPGLGKTSFGGGGNDSNAGNAGIVIIRYRV